MERLMDVLNKVRVKAAMEKEPTIEMLQELNSAALNYYNKRQGLLFSPHTDDGQARLHTVGKLSFVTGKISQRCKEAFANRDQELGQNRNQVHQHAAKP